jgi:polygalacturonase
LSTDKVPYPPRHSISNCPPGHLLRNTESSDAHVTVHHIRSGSVWGTRSASMNKNEILPIFLVAWLWVMQPNFFFLEAQNVSEPVKLSVSDFGAIADGITLNTPAIQKAIDVCSQKGGGVVTFPDGRYLTGTVQLKDGVTLYLDNQAAIIGSTNADDYLNLDPFKSGSDGDEKMGYALIIGKDVKNVGLDGPGVIDGQGAALRKAEGKYNRRPFLVRWVRCTGVTVHDVTLTGSGAWTMNFFQSQNVSVQHVRIHSVGLGNNDGIDVDSTYSVRISDCAIESGDDAICLKATSAQPCRDITVTGCELNTSCNAIKFGTESLGDFENIQISQCEIRKAGLAGIALYSVDGAHLHDVTLDHITMDNVGVPISVRLGSRLKTFRSGDFPKLPGSLSSITIKNVQATNAQKIGILINGIPGHPVDNLNLENIQIEMTGGGKAQDAARPLPENEAAYPEIGMFGRVTPAYGLYLRHATGITLINVTISSKAADQRPVMMCLDVDGLTLDGFTAPLVEGVAPAVYDGVNHRVVKNSPILESLMQ